MIIICNARKQISFGCFALKLQLFFDTIVFVAKWKRVNKRIMTGLVLLSYFNPETRPDRC